MTISLFIAILTVGAAVSSLLTQAIKKWYQNANKQYSANMVALINALIIGIGGCAVAYMLLNIPWTINNILCMLLMSICVWLGSMLGYDKIIQLVSQLNITKSENNNDKK